MSSSSAFLGASATEDSSGVQSVSAVQFLSSLGVDVHIDQGYSGQSYVEPLNYLGVREIRTGAWNIPDAISVHNQTGVHVDVFVEDYSTGISAARQLATAGALLSIEGPNEPNNFPITYNGQQGGGSNSWLPVAEMQRDLYAAVKSDSLLKTYPVFNASETGAETSNVGLQFLKIPDGANTDLPSGTTFADFANVHNYVIGTLGTYADNQAWNAADPTLNSSWDGLYVESGVTWNGHYPGYPLSELQTLPRVTTETGWDSKNDPGGERVQGVVLLNTYLAQFKRGWSYTFIYQLRDGEGGVGNQGLFNADSTPKLAATYIHNLTTILQDNALPPSLGRLNYKMANQPSTVHDLLLQKSSGDFELVVWDERANGSDAVAVDLSRTRSLVRLYDPTVGTSATQTFQNVSSVSLNLSDHPLVIEVPK